MEHLSLVKFFMIISGTWRVPLKTPSPKKQIFYNIYSIIIQVYYNVFVICLIVELALVWEIDFVKTTENVGVTILCTLIMIKAYICQKKKVVELISLVLEVEEGLHDFESDDLEVYRSTAQYNKHLSIFLFIYSSMCGVTLVFTKFVVYLQQLYAENSDLEIEPPLPYIIWRPVDEKKHYITAFVLDIVSASVGCTFNTVTQLIFLSLMTFLVGQLEILQNRFRNFGKNFSSKASSTEKYQCLRSLILEHKRIIIMEHLQIVKYLMIAVGTWRMPFAIHSPTKVMLYNIYSAMVQLYYCVFVICLIIELPLVWEKDLNKAMENIAITILCTIILIKVYICQKKKVKDIIAYILQVETELDKFDKENLAEYKSHAVYTRYISIILFFYSSMCGVTLVCTKFVVYLQLKSAAVRNHCNASDIEAPLPYVIWRPFDEKKYFIPAFLIDCASAIIGCTYNTVTQLIFISIMTFVIGQLKILQNCYRNLGKTGETFGCLRVLILEHKKIIMYVENLDECMKFLMLLEFTINSIQITSLLFQFITLEVDPIFIFRVTYSSLMILQIFLLAWHANEIKEQSMHISQAIYESCWYEFELELRRSLLIVMMRAQRPLTLSIGPFFTMTNETAVTSMKAAYSYLTILNRKYSRR